jgi:hypothetical protein
VDQQLGKWQLGKWQAPNTKHTYKENIEILEYTATSSVIDVILQQVELLFYHS